MIPANSHQVKLLESSAEVLGAKHYKPYLTLRHLLQEKPKGYKADFEAKFRSYYGMNQAHLGDDFDSAFFRHLFALRPPVRKNLYASILSDLARHPRKKGDVAIQFSFVSKLVAIHDESQPIIDRHVSDFFGIRAPAAGDINFRIAGFETNLGLIKCIYQDWSTMPKVRSLLSKVRRSHPELGQVADTRVLDFLVWLVGREKLWKMKVSV